MAKFIPLQEAPLSYKYESALRIIVNWHCRNTKGFQVRRNGTPYLGHLLATSALVLQAGGDEDEAIAALCHDAVEDAEVDLKHIESLFGLEVARIVGAVSEDKRVDKIARKAAYVQQIKDSDRSVALVSCADKLHNLQCDRISGAAIYTEEYKFFSALAPVYLEKLGDDHMLAFEFKRLLESY